MSKTRKFVEIYSSISAACFAWACKFVFYRQWFHCISILKCATKKFSVLSIILIDAHNFTHSRFPSRALNVLLKDYLIGQLETFWNSTQKVCAKNKTKTNSKKTKKSNSKQPEKETQCKKWSFWNTKSPYWIALVWKQKGSIFRIRSNWTIKEWWIHGKIY